MGNVLLFPIRCNSCGKLVEQARRCYAIPTCFACLPPPEPLPICPMKKPRCLHTTVNDTPIGLVCARCGDVVKPKKKARSK